MTVLSNTNITELYTNAYDHAGRLLQTKYKINTAVDTVLLVNNTYDDLGRLIQKKRHNNTDIEEFDYNIRNWTTRLKSGAFEEKLFYNNSSKPLYNGNISAQTWTYNGVEKGYNFEYDDLNRLLNATFKQGTSTQGNGFFDEKFTYDKMGNITTLMRKKDNQLIDDLSIYYYGTGNQIHTIYDAAGTRGMYDVKEYQNKNYTSSEMAYDVNGNLTKDLDRDIVAIKYNLLNLPEIIQFKNGNQIRNLYDASGQKLRTQNITIEYYITQPIIAENQIYDLEDMDQDNEEIYLNGTEYIGNVEYSHFESYYMGEHFDHYGIDFMQLYNSEGYCDNSFKYNYYRRDHLGNNREVWRAPYKVGNTNYPAATIQRTQYYPSGLPWASNSIDNAWMQNKKYNGKEFVEMHGYDTYDYGARGMYAAIGGRFMSVDPLAEKYYSISPYAYCAGNPVNRVDIQGKFIIFINGQHGGSGGSSKYWNGIDNKIMTHFKDQRKEYVDGAMGGWLNTILIGSNTNANYRILAGHAWGEDNAERIIKSLKRNNETGKIIEPLKLVSHSMGGAFAQGLAEAIVEFVKKHPELCNGLKISEYDFDPFQASSLTPIDGVDRHQYIHNSGTGFLPYLANEREQGLDDKHYHEAAFEGSHSISSYMDEINSLPQGTYEFDRNGNIVPQ